MTEKSMHGLKKAKNQKNEITKTKNYNSSKNLGVWNEDEDEWEFVTLWQSAGKSFNNLKITFLNLRLRWTLKLGI